MLVTRSHRTKGRDISAALLATTAVTFAAVFVAPSFLAFLACCFDEFLASSGPDLYPSGLFFRALQSTVDENHLQSCLWDTLMDAQRGHERQ